MRCGVKDGGKRGEGYGGNESRLSVLEAAAAAIRSNCSLLQPPRYSVPAPKAQLFFSTQTIFAAVWALVLLHEEITNHELVGGGILVAGLTAVSYLQSRKDDEVEEDKKTQ